MPIFIDPNDWNSRIDNMRKNQYSDHQILFGLRDRFRWHGLVDNLINKGHTETEILSSFGNRLVGNNPPGLPDAELSLPGRYSSVNSSLNTQAPTPFDIEKQNKKNEAQAQEKSPLAIGGALALPFNIGDRFLVEELESPDQLTTNDSFGEGANRWDDLTLREKAEQQALVIPWVDPVSAGVAAFASGTVVALNSGLPLLSAAMKGVSKIVPAALLDIPIGSIVEEFEQASDSPILSLAFNVALGAIIGRKLSLPDEDSITARIKKLAEKKGIKVDEESIRNLFKPLASKRTQTEFDRDFDKLTGDRWIELYHNQVLGVQVKQMISNSVGEASYGPKSKRIGEILHVFIDSRNRPDKIATLFKRLTPEQQSIVKSFQELQSEHGFISDRVSKQYGKIRDTELDLGILHTSKEDYVNRLWERPFEKGTGRFGSFFTSSKSSRKRTFETILDGWAAGHKLKITDGVDAMLARGAESIHVKHNRKMINHFAGMTDDAGDFIIKFNSRPGDGYELADLKNLKLWDWVGTTEAVPIIKRVQKITETIKRFEGDKKFSAPIQKLQKVASVALQSRGFTASEADNAVSKLVGAKKENIGELVEKLISEKEIVTGVKLSTILDKGAILTEDGALLLKKDIYMKPDNFKRFNAMFGTSQLAGQATIDAITQLNSELKSFRFAHSFFHGNAFLRSFYFGGAPVKGFIQDVKAGEGFMTSLSRLTPRGAIRSGRQAWLNGGPEIEALMRQGMTVGVIADWQDNLIRQQSTVISRLLDKTKASKYAKDVVFKLRDDWNDFIFKEMGGPLKTRLALIELRSLTKKHPELDLNKAAEMVATFANDDFGGLNLARLGVDPTVWHILRLVSLAPDWNLSNIRTMVKATEAGIEGQIYRHFWARSITKIAMLNLTVGALLSASADEEMTANYQKAWDEGQLRALDIDITAIYKLLGGTEDVKKYFSSAGHFKDPIKYAIAMSRTFFPEEDKDSLPDIVDVLDSKASIFYKIVADGLSGEDWMGRQFTTARELAETGETTRPSLTALSPEIADPGFFERTPSFILNRLKGSLPIPVENMLSWWLGEMEGFDAVMNGVGATVSSEPYYTPDRKREQKELRKELKRLRRRGIIK